MLRRLAWVGALVLVAAACSGGHSPPRASTSLSGADAGAPTAATAPGTSAPNNTTTKTSNPGSTTTEVSVPGVVSTPTSTGARAGGPATTATNATTPVSSSQVTSGLSAGPPPAEPGTYPLSQSGGIQVGSLYLAFPSQGALVVGAAEAGAYQVWQHLAGQSSASSSNSSGLAGLEQDLANELASSTGLGLQASYTKVQFRAAGPFLVSATEPTGEGVQACTFAPALAFPPWPPALGEQASSHGTCGSSSLTLDEVVTGTQSLTVNGKTYTTWVIDTTLHTAGDLASSGEQTDMYSPALRLPLYESSQIQGTYFGVTFAVRSISAMLTAGPGAG